MKTVREALDDEEARLKAGGLNAEGVAAQGTGDSTIKQPARRKLRQAEDAEGQERPAIPAARRRAEDLEEIDRLRAKVTDLEEKLAESQHMDMPQQMLSAHRDAAQHRLDEARNELVRAMEKCAAPPRQAPKVRSALRKSSATAAGKTAGLRRSRTPRRS